MARKPTGQPAGHPVIYQDETQRPTSVTVRIPAPLYAQLSRFCWEARTTHSQVILAGLARVLPPPSAPVPVPEVAAFDPHKQRLGSLCKRQHAFQDTGQSLRHLISGACVECTKAQQRKGP